MPRLAQDRKGTQAVGAHSRQRRVQRQQQLKPETTQRAVERRQTTSTAAATRAGSVRPEHLRAYGENTHNNRLAALAQLGIHPESTARMPKKTFTDDAALKETFTDMDYQAIIPAEAGSHFHQEELYPFRSMTTTARGCGRHGWRKDSVASKDEY